MMTNMRRLSARLSVKRWSLKNETPLGHQEQEKATEEIEEEILRQILIPKPQWERTEILDQEALAVSDPPSLSTRQQDSNTRHENRVTYSKAKGMHRWLLYCMLHYFSQRLEFRKLEWMIWPAATNFTRAKIPIKLEMCIFDEMRLSDGEKAIRVMFPHLANHWSRFLPRRCEEW